MKRYRVLRQDFDTGATILELEIKNEGEDDVKKIWHDNKENIKRGLLLQYGCEEADTKLQNYIDLGNKPFSVVAYHNRFADQIRRAFVGGGYYPALTGACALGERILNHLILDLRADFKTTPEYKKVYRKNSFEDWMMVISTLESWEVLRPEAAKPFRKLAEIRNRRAIHFDPATDRDDRPLALEAIRSLNDIIYEQFGSFGPHPWFIPDILGESYIKKATENDPFIRKVYLPNCYLVGPQHALEDKDDQLLIHDDHDYEDREVSDDEFRDLRQKAADARTEPESTS